MRLALVTLGILFAASVQIARADLPSSAAPADEYFGPAQQSILEIRNRLDDYDKRDASEMLDPGTPVSLNHLELAVLDWQHKYPRDPWLPRILAHLMREYWRAGAVSSPPGLAALGVMRSTYADSPWTTQTVAMIYGGGEPATSVRDSEQTTAYVAPPPPAPAPEEAAPSTDAVSDDDTATAAGTPDSDVAAPSQVASNDSLQSDVPVSYGAPPPDAVTSDRAPTYANQTVLPSYATWPNGEVSAPPPPQ